MMNCRFALLSTCFTAFCLPLFANHLVLKPLAKPGARGSDEIAFLGSFYRPKSKPKKRRQLMGEKYIIRDPKTIPAPQRAKVFSELETISTNAHIFAELFKKVDPSCLFPIPAHYTIFIPYNYAVTQHDLNQLDHLSREALCRFLTQFIIPQEIPLQERMQEKSYNTLAKTKVTVKKGQAATTYYFGTAEILLPFALTGDGVTIHIIDRIDSQK